MLKILYHPLGLFIFILAKEFLKNGSILLNLWYLGGRIEKTIRNKNIIDNELNTIFT
jgi:hypothetical protein